MCVCCMYKKKYIYNLDSLGNNIRKIAFIWVCYGTASIKIRSSKICSYHDTTPEQALGADGPINLVLVVCRLNVCSVLADCTVLVCDGV
jgi:hypothetical protein